jgi:hypothetical protein
MNLVLVLVSFQIVYEVFSVPSFFFFFHFLFQLLLTSQGSMCRLSSPPRCWVIWHFKALGPHEKAGEEGKGAGGGDDLMDTVCEGGWWD